MTRSPEAGFTLIEALIALAILSITAISFLRSTEANITRVAALEARTAATWVAQNRLTELALGLHPVDASVQMLGQSFTIEVTERPADDPSLLQVDVVAAAPDGGASVHVSGLLVALGGGSS